MRTKLFVMMAVITVLIFAAGGGLDGRLSLQPSVPHRSVTVSERTENRGIDNLVLDIRMPVVAGLADTSFEKLLNARIRAQVSAARQDALRQSRIDPAYVFVLRVDYALTCAQDILSLRVTDDLDNGGTGKPHTVYYNADIQKSASLTLDDLFESRDYREAVDNLIRNTMQADEHFFLEDFTGVDNHSKFFISNGQLHIAFSKYEIASGMAGEPIFSVPSGLLWTQIKPRYRRCLS